MIETDAPYLLPRTLSPKPKDRRNEPAFLPHIVEELARDRGEDVATTAANATATTRAFFGLPSRSEEHTSELQSLMRISYAVFCLKKKKTYNTCHISNNYNHKPTANK